MLRLLLAQRARGHRAGLVCPEPPQPDAGGLAQRARQAGVEPELLLAPLRGARAWRDRADAHRLRALLADRPCDVIHVWHTRDHVLAWRAAGCGRRTGGPRIVRSVSSAEPIPPWPWNRWLFGRAADALLCVSDASARANQRLVTVPVAAALGAVDLARFAPAPPEPGARERLGLRPRDAVVGVVARIQRHRRFELLLEAFRQLAERREDARLLLVGRGTHQDEVARQPARRLGIEDRVVFAGWRGADYADVLRAIDVLTFLVPGSDGTCRAVLEAHACGLPVVASRRGALPEIVADGETGCLVDEDAAALCRVWQELLADPERRARMGRAARRRAERLFRPERLCDDVDALYRAAGAGDPAQAAGAAPRSPWSSISSL
jgi:glycosyltransferase involved in cell wall biosynthesis